MSINDNRSRIKATAKRKQPKNAVIHLLQLGDDERDMLRLIYITQAAAATTAAAKIRA